jgi:zinc protease
MMTPTMFGAASIALSLALSGSIEAEHPPVGHRSGPSPVAASRSGPLDSLTITYDVGGVKVIHRPVGVTDVVAVNLYLLGGSRQVTAATAGVEPFLLYASEYGTQRYPGDATRLALAHTGSWITVVTTADYTRFAFRGIKQEFDSTWAVFAERIQHPSLDSAAMAITRGQMLNSIKSSGESPDGQVARIADSLAFEAHPYAVPVEGTESSIATLTAADLRKYATEQMVTSRMLLVVVGDISRAQVERVVTATLATLPRGNYVWSLPAEWPAKATRVAAVGRKLPTNYILGYFSGPLRSSPDYPAFEIATGYLGGILQDVIRSEGLSYAAGAPFLDRGATGGGVYVSTVRPDTVVKIINTAIDYIQQEPLPRAALVKHAQRYDSRYYYQTESNAEQADVLAQAHIFHGDFHAAADYGAVLRKVSGSDVRRVAKQYIKHIQYAYLGDTTKVPTKLMMKP